MADKEKPVEKKAAAVIACGHQNKHYIPPAGMEDAKLVCTLERGHAPVRVERRGPKGEDISTYEVIHSGPYKRMRRGVLVDDVAQWSDAAGIPVQ